MTSEQLEKWRKLNRAKLFPGKRNRWVWIVSQDIADSNDEIEVILKHAIKRLSFGAATDYKLIRTSASRIQPKRVVQRREDLPEGPLPFVKPGPVSWAETEFSWHSPLESVPWPAEDWRLGLVPVHDPTEAELMLDSIGAPPGDAPKRRTAIETSIDELVDSAVETPQRAVFTAGLGALGLYLLLKKLKG